MKIFIVHNAYRQAGGEDVVVGAEKTLLVRNGNEVNEYLRDNNEIVQGGICSTIALGTRTIWSSGSRSDLHWLLKKSKPDVVHFHNTFPLISPAAYYACADLGVPVVQTLHNYRLFCPAAAFFRNGQVCEECVEKSPWQAVRHACFRESRTATSAVAAMLSVHHLLGTWTKHVDRYIALSEFSRTKFIAAGLPEAKVVVKPNFVLHDPGIGTHDGDYAVFIGRLSEEKGLRTLMQAWRRVNPAYLLRVIGDGPLFDHLQSEVDRHGLSNVHLHGRLPREKSLKVLQRARCLILPSNCYENFPMTIAEAYACGTPVIASRLGAMAEIVQDGRTGLHFTAGDADDLATKVDWVWGHADDTCRMASRARAEFETKYTAQGNYGMLMAIYESVVGSRRAIA